jgi:hypothetical protein
VMLSGLSERDGVGGRGYRGTLGRLMVGGLQRSNRANHPTDKIRIGDHFKH